MRFNLGDTVEWTSSSRGTTKKKCGRVCVVIAAGRRAPSAFPEFSNKMPLDHESYIVRVEQAAHEDTTNAKAGQRKLKYYWPRVSALRLRDRPA